MSARSPEPSGWIAYSSWSLFAWLVSYRMLRASCAQRMPLDRGSCREQCEQQRRRRPCGCPPAPVYRRSCRPRTRSARRRATSCRIRESRARSTRHGHEPRPRAGGVVGERAAVRRELDVVGQQPAAPRDELPDERARVRAVGVDHYQRASALDREQRAVGRPGARLPREVRHAAAPAVVHERRAVRDGQQATEDQIGAPPVTAEAPSALPIEHDDLAGLRARDQLAVVRPLRREAAVRDSRRGARLARIDHVELVARAAARVRTGTAATSTVPSGDHESGPGVWPCVSRSPRTLRSPLPSGRER